MPPRNIKTGGGGAMTLDARFTQMAQSTAGNRQASVAQMYACYSFLQRFLDSRLFRARV